MNPKSRRVLFLALAAGGGLLLVIFVAGAGLLIRWSTGPSVPVTPSAPPVQPPPPSPKETPTAPTPTPTTPAPTPSSPPKPLATVRVPVGFRPAPDTEAEPYTGTGWAKEIVHKWTEMELVFIPAGSFMMGSPPGEPGRNEDENLHKVTISRPFYLAKCELTVGQLRKAGKTTTKGEARIPACGFSARECGQILTMLGDSLTLPTEAQWEYACRAGTATAYNWGPDMIPGQANHNSTGRPGNPITETNPARLVPVGSFKPNAWGLYDMHGNVSEWCLDKYEAYPAGSVDDPIGRGVGNKLYAIRGGSWFVPARDCRAASRAKGGEAPVFDAGLRACLPLPANSVLMTTTSDKAPPEMSEADALEMLEDKCRLVRDEKAPGRPIVELRFTENFASDRLLQAAVRIRTLQAVTARGENVTEAGVAVLRGLPALKFLDLKQAHIRDSALVSVGEMKGLEYLSLCATFPTNAGLAHLGGLANLKYLDLSHTRVTNAGLASLTNLKALRELTLTMIPVDDTGFEYLKEMTALERLDLSYTHVTGKGASVLASLLALRNLDVSASFLTQAGLDDIGTLKSLRRLDLSRDNLNMISEGQLAGLTDLEELNLSETHVTDASMPGLKDLKNLRRLNLARTKVSAEGLAVLKDLKNLEELHLGEAPVSDRGAAVLSGMKNLTVLKIAPAAMTPEIKAAIKQAMPNCKITYSDSP